MNIAKQCRTHTQRLTLGNLNWFSAGPAAHFTMNRYRRTSSVGAMLAELKWESLASRHHTVHVVLFHKIHYGLVAVNMPLKLKYKSGPTRTENSLAYHIPASSAHYQKNFFSTVQSETGTVFLMKLFIHRSLSISGITSYINYVCGTPPILVKGSRDPSVRSQRHYSILIST